MNSAAIRTPAAQLNTIAHRTIDLLREVGTLLLAFAPFDYMLQPEVEVWSLAGFVVLGTTLFIWSLRLELRRQQ
jgi:hypothetical protein